MAAHTNHPSRRPLEPRYEWRAWGHERRATLDRLEQGDELARRCQLGLFREERVA